MDVFKHYRIKGLVSMSKSRKNKAVALKYNVEEDTSPVVIASDMIMAEDNRYCRKKGFPCSRTTAQPPSYACWKWEAIFRVDLYEVVAAIYCRAIGASARIKNEEALSRGSKSREGGGGNLLRSRSLSRQGKKRRTGKEAGVWS